MMRWSKTETRHTMQDHHERSRDFNGTLVTFTAMALFDALDGESGHYYRIQGPVTLIEFDNSEDNANHFHSVWRDPENDFGEDLLMKHLIEEHGAVDINDADHASSGPGSTASPD